MSPILPCICQNRKKNRRPVTSTQQDHYCKNESAGGVTGSIALAVSYRTDWPDPSKSAGRLLLMKLPTAGRLKLHHSSYSEERAEKMDKYPEHVSDPVTEGSISQLPHLPSEQRGDCPCGHCCVGIPKQPIICRSTYLRKAKYFC